MSFLGLGTLGTGRLRANGMSHPLHTHTHIHTRTRIATIHTRPIHCTLRWHKTIRKLFPNEPKAKSSFSSYSNTIAIKQSFSYRKLQNAIGKLVLKSVKQYMKRLWSNGVGTFKGWKVEWSTRRMETEWEEVAPMCNSGVTLSGMASCGIIKIMFDIDFLVFF